MADEKLTVYTEEQIVPKLQEFGLGDWYMEDGWLRRKYNTDGWPTTLMLVNAIGYLCATNNQLGAHAAARSRHMNGVNTTLGDGSVRFVNNNITAVVWWSLGTRAGNELATEF